MKYISLLSIVALSLILSACKKHTTDPIDDPPKPISAYFPNSVGSKWIYSVLDKQNSTYDTLQITIVGDTTLSNGKYVSLWRYASKSSVDTFYYFIKSDTVEIFKSVLFLDTRYLLPFSVGNSWKCNDTHKVSDSIYVTKDSIFTNLSYDKPKGYYLERNWGGLNDYGSATYWFVPRIGMIKEEIREWGFSLSNKSYNLISYTIK